MITHNGFSAHASLPPAAASTPSGCNIIIRHLRFRHDDLPVVPSHTAGRCAGETAVAGRSVNYGRQFHWEHLSTMLLWGS